MGVFDQIKSGSSSPSSGGVFGQLKKVDDYHNARGTAEADEQWQVAHQWDNSLSAPIADIRKSTLMQQVQAAQSAPQEQPQDNSRKIPIIGPVLKGLDWFAKTPVQHFIADVGQTFYTPGAGLANIAGLTGAAESAVARTLPKLGPIVQKGVSEVVANAPIGAGQVLATNPDASVKDILSGAAIGGAAGGVLGAAGKGVFSGLAKFGDRAASKITGNAIQNVAENTRSRVISPFAEEAAAFNPVAKGYTENVARTFEPRVSQSIDNFVSDVPKATNVPPIAEQGGVAGFTFKTSKGSSYNVDAQGRTQRTKTQHEGHDPNDVGLKDPSEATVYVDKDEASRIGSHFGMNKEARPKVVYREDGIYLLSWNAKENRWGIHGKPIPYTKTPEVGRSPVEFWKLNKDPQLGTTASKVHAGNEITEIINPKQSIPKQVIAVEQQPIRPKSNALKFSQTVKDSQHTAPELITAMQEKPMVGARTTDVINRQQASELIEKHGAEGLYGKLMAKKLNFSPAETTAAQMLAKQYSSLGGDENLSKAIDLVSKTAKGGREMGQAIQALSQWNKLDAEGALLVAERQLNKGVKNTEDWQKLTVAQGTPIKEAAQRIGTAQETKNLADEVLSIVTNKQAGEALTDAEKATIKQFQDQVKLINEKGKGILSKPRAGKANETIKEVSQIEPKARTRDQVVSYLDAKAEQARKRIAASRNVGFAAVNKGNPVADYAIIGASHLAKGVVKLSDFTEQMVKDFGDSIKPYIHEVYKKSTNIFRKENGLPTVEELDRVVSQAVKNDRFTKEEAVQFKAWAAEIGNMSAEFKVEATQDLQIALKELGDSTLGNKIATVQTGAQLLNAVTVGRNIIGNAALITAEKVNKVIAVPTDFAFSTLTGERTIKFLPNVQESMFRNFMKGTGAGWEGISPTGTLDSYGIHPNVFGKKNPLKYITKSLGASMQGFDFAAYRVAYGDVLATYGEQLGKAQGLSKAQIKEQMPKLIESLDARIHDLADEAGRYATFQDDTLLSQGADMLKQGLNKLTDLPMQKLVEMGLPKKYSLEGFGLGDVVLKYAKTPANLVMRALDYSPIGFVRSIMELAPLAYNRSKFNQFKATRSLSRAITGTLGLTGMGYILADAGILTGSSSMDKDVRSIQEQSGQGAYKVNWSALTRFFTSGFDKEAAKFQKGDNLMDYAWLQPAAISVAMGVNANKAVKDRKDGSDVSGWQIIEKGLLGGLQTVLENPMVQGVSGVVDALSDVVKRQDPTKLKNIGKGVPASFVPTLLNQARAATDNNQRETFSKDLLTEMGNLMANKVPGLSKKLPVSYDSMGNARERIQGGQANTVTQYLTSFFSPARMTEYQVSPEAKLVLDLMEKSGDANVLPRIASKSFHVSQGKNVKDLKVELDAKQFSQLQQNLGQMVTAELSKQAAYLSDPNKSIENKVKKVSDILTVVGKKARENIGVQMGFKKTDIKS